MDLYLSNLIQNFQTPFLDGVMLFFTYLADWQVVLILMLLICFYYAIKKRWDYILAILFSIGGGQVLVWIIKHVVQRPRPIPENALIFEKSFSFPSGHAFVAIAFYGLLIYFLLYAIKNRFWKIFIIGIYSIMALAIGISRIYLGVHWFTDVLAGFILGAIAFIVIIFSLKKCKKIKFFVKTLLRC